MNSTETKKVLQNIARGACFLGSGGGGGYQTSMKFIDNYLTKNPHKSLNIKTLDQFDKEKNGGDEKKRKKNGIVVAYMGAPEKMEDVDCPTAVIAGIRKFIAMHKNANPLNPIEKIDCILPVEIGPISSITACLAAMELNIPVLDLDGAGRAVPTLDLITYTTNGGISVSPAILSSEETDDYPDCYNVTLDISDNKGGSASKMESLARPVLSMHEFDQKAGIVLWYFDDIEKLRKENICIKGTLSICEKLGSYISDPQHPDNLKIKEFTKFFNSKFENVYEFISEKCSGTLQEASVSTFGGFDVGTIIIKNGEQTFRIIFQNESLILWDSQSPEPLVMAPDLISYIISGVSNENQLVYTNDDIMENGALRKELQDAKITVFGIRAPKELRETETNMQKIREHLSGKHSSHKAMPQQYMSMINTLGYYGKYIPLKK
jgi:DUF917 family protein